IAYWQSGELRVLDVSGKPIARFKPSIDGNHAGDRPLLIAAHGHELWLLDGSTKLLQRFELP
ncbi:hypothetical protein ACQ7B2_15905, partial [Escherichia coli]